MNASRLLYYAEKLRILQSSAGVDMAINGERENEDGSTEHILWFARSMDPFNADGRGIVRFLREISLCDETLLYFCPTSSAQQAKELMLLSSEEQRWFTFMEGMRFYAGDREMEVCASQVIILDDHMMETKLEWSETKQCNGNRDSNELVACYISAQEEEDIKRLFVGDS